ncbi:MAG: efflux RND transporter periplasmic adaptor subunit [Acidobacteriota bacterium]|nr:efflux RND transporter periplasmic adaptor subunit [Acidobacteriota bacterium]
MAVTACSGSGKAASEGPGGGRGPREPMAVPVTIGQVVEKPMPVELSVIGTVEAYSTVQVKSQVQGEILSVHFKEGDDVKKGDLLFNIDPSPFRATLQQAEANLARDTAQANNAQQELKRYADLIKRGIATQEQYDTAHTNVASYEAAIRADQATIDNAKLQLSYCSITAPISGRTGALLVHAGNLVKVNDVPLVVINQISPIYVTFAVPEAQLPDIKRYRAAGTLHVEATIPNDGGPAAQGTITFVDNAVDPTTGTIKLKGTFPNADHRLWPGQFVNVVLTLTTQPDAIVVPSQAVQSGQQGQYVFVVKPDQTVESRQVQVARTLGNDTVVSSGLKPGETVVTDGQLRLVPGAKVSIKNTPAGTR